MRRPTWQKNLATLARRLIQYQLPSLGIRPTPKGFFPASSQSTLSRLPAARWLQANRREWGIENGSHQQLDVTLNDNRCRVRNTKGLLILGMLQRLVISLFMH